MTIDPEYGVITSAEAGETVWDDLTGQHRKILRVDPPEGTECAAYWLECDATETQRTGGGRYPWEISPPRKGETEQ